MKESKEICEAGFFSKANIRNKWDQFTSYFTPATSNGRREHTAQIDHTALLDRAYEEYTQTVLKQNEELEEMFEGLQTSEVDLSAEIEKIKRQLQVHNHSNTEIQNESQEATLVRKPSVINPLVEMLGTYPRLPQGNLTPELIQQTQAERIEHHTQIKQAVEGYLQSNYESLRATSEQHRRSQ